MDCKRALASSLFLALAACGSADVRRFPLREPMWTDTDLRFVSVACERRPTDKDARHVACAPEPYVSPLAWDGIDNSIFRPISKMLAVDPPGETPNVNALDEVPDSAWFTNRVGKRRPSREELLRGACNPEDLLDGEAAAPGSWVIDQGKANGASPGFRIKIGAKKKYLLKSDTVEQPERPSAASAIGAAIYHAVGFNTSCEQIVRFDRRVLMLTPGLVVTDNAGVTKPFDERALDAVLDIAKKSGGGTLRMQASAWLPGYLIGPFRYEKTRGDDPNDAIPHEDRRDLRGARVLAAWLDHFDAREQNSMDSWIAEDHARPDSSPGFVRHYYLDTSDCFGSEWAWDAISRRLGSSYLLDWGDIALDFVTLGIPKRPWERIERAPGFEMFGYYESAVFDPEGWKNEYPNSAFGRATERDDAWMARILSRFDRADIDALVSLGRFSKPAVAAHLAEVMELRLRKILDRYLLRLSPLADLRVDGGATLCAVDLARRRAVRPDGAFRYTASLRGAALGVDVRAGAEVCVALPHVAGDGGAEDDSPSRYAVVTIANGAARSPIRAHLYDLGPRRGYRLVGLERPDDAGDR